MSRMRFVFAPLPGQTYSAAVKTISQGKPIEVTYATMSKSATTDTTLTFSGDPGESYFMQLFPSGAAKALSGTATFSSDVTLTFGALFTVFEEE
jgi:hypothetical protein